MRTLIRHTPVQGHAMPKVLFTAGRPLVLDYLFHVNEVLRTHRREGKRGLRFEVLPSANCIFCSLDRVSRTISQLSEGNPRNPT